MAECRENTQGTSHIVVIRSYKPDDGLYCKEIIKQGIMSSLNATFLGTIFKEITFQLMILFAAIMFIFFGLPFTLCLVIAPVVLVFFYIGTYVAFTAKTMELGQEVSDIQRIYMSDASTHFWVAEAFEPRLTTVQPKEAHYTILTEQQFRELKVDVSLKIKKIVGTIGLCKSYKLYKGAWIKRLSVHENYRRKGIASYLLNVAVQFTVEQGYTCVNTLASEYMEYGRELCLKKGFELKQMYHKPIVGSLITILMYELTYQIKPGDDSYVPMCY